MTLPNELDKRGAWNGKWCAYCMKDTHTDAECWSTRPADWHPGRNLPYIWPESPPASSSLARSIPENIVKGMLAGCRLDALEQALNCYSPDDSATDWADKIRALKTEGVRSVVAKLDLEISTYPDECAAGANLGSATTPAASENNQIAAREDAPVAMGGQHRTYSPGSEVPGHYTRSASGRGKMASGPEPRCGDGSACLDQEQCYEAGECLRHHLQPSLASPTIACSDSERARLADANLKALLDYTAGFYSVAMGHGMKRGETANAIAHVESAARALHRLATSSATGRWISVEERLPHTHSVLGSVVESDDFYVRPDEPMLDICTYFPEVGEWRISLGTSEVVVKVSHWMPLPERPVDIRKDA